MEGKPLTRPSVYLEEIGVIQLEDLRALYLGKGSHGGGAYVVTPHVKQELCVVYKEKEAFAKWVTAVNEAHASLDIPNPFVEVDTGKAIVNVTSSWRVLRKAYDKLEVRVEDCEFELTVCDAEGSLDRFWKRVQALQTRGLPPKPVDF